MAKKIQKGKTVKKAEISKKKAIVKKVLAKNISPKKTLSSKVAAKKTLKTSPSKKTVKKAILKTVKKVAKASNVKSKAKVISKNTSKKITAKKVIAKKVIAKKVVKPAKKVIAKKVVAKKLKAKKIIKPLKKTLVKKVIKPAKKLLVKKVAVKKVLKPLKNIVVKAIVKKAIVKPVVKAEARVVIAAKPTAIEKLLSKKIKKDKIAAKKSKSLAFDLNEDTRDSEVMIVEYKTPSIPRPMGPVPKPHVNTDKRTRYTDSELKEFKELILKKLSEAQKDFDLLKSTLSHKDDNGTDDTSPTFKLLEDGSDVLSKEETSHLAGRQEKFIQNLQNALVRVENKTYGICRVTGKLISKERLRIVPHATLAIEAKLEQQI